jgi:hypothetical protein
MIDIRLIGDVIIYIGAVAIALTALGAFLRIVVVRPLMKKLREELIPQTAVIHAEMTPDHGHSMKDHVTKTAAKVEELEKRFGDHLVNHP